MYLEEATNHPARKMGRVTLKGYFHKIDGGERGIRTLGTLTRSTVFETAPFDHSGTSPQRVMAMRRAR